MLISPNATVMPVLRHAVERQASDVYAVVGLPPTYRASTQLLAAEGSACTVEQVLGYLKEMLAEAAFARFEKDRGADAACALESGERFRINAFWEKGHPGFVARLIPTHIPPLEALHAPQAILEVLEEPHGLVLVTGATGSGKSTLLASMIEDLNEHRRLFITTLEDPIEFLFTPKQSTIIQRELGSDVPSFPEGIRSLLRQNPDVVLVGEMRDLDTIAATITLAETGHLVFASLHTNNAAEAVERIVDVFPAGQQAQIRMQFSMALRCIVSRSLLPGLQGGLVPAYEVLVNTPAVSHLIRDAKTVQIPNVLQTSASDNMHTLDQDLCRLIQENLISVDTGVQHAQNPHRVCDIAALHGAHQPK
ncbi:MAG: hypothetical protein RL141_1124 [Candidatus Parcubacteria bacterium]|jgi:twitching motility protein PilT